MTTKPAPPPRQIQVARTVKVTDELWADAHQVAAQMNTTVSQLVRDYLTKLVRQKGN